MISTYSRPKTIHEAINILKKDTHTIPMAGGTTIRQLARHQELNLVDLQDLGMNVIKEQGDWVEVGAMITLNEMAQSNVINPAIKMALRYE
jgi:CO/xanthine dehydrogenase FAD-binding subunit